MTDALITNAWANNKLYLWQRLFAAFDQQGKIGSIKRGIENNLLSNLKTVRIFQYKRQFFLFAWSKIYLDFSVCLIDAFNFVGARTECVINGRVASLNLKRDLGRLSFQSFG